jgi:hypothetical protein
MIQWLTAATAMLVLGAPALRALDCDDSDPCTVNDACGVDGTCQGTFQMGKSCNDFQDCTTNDTCRNDPLTGMPGCSGDAVQDGTPCGGGCGTCMQLAPIPGVPPLCSGDLADNGKSCDPSSFALGPCFVGKCQITGAGGITFAICLPSFKVCPDTDGNPCTDNCNFNTGNCEKNAPKCDGVCSSCNPATGMCETKTLGASCDDSDPCSAKSSCQTIEGVPFAVCLAGAPTVDTPTPTVTPPGSTPISTPTSTATTGAPTSTPTTAASPTPAACVGDCNDNKIVAINELVTGVNIALGSFPISQCSAFDTNGNQMVDINELIAGVGSLLNGCV